MNPNVLSKVKDPGDYINLHTHHKPETPDQLIIRNAYHRLSAVQLTRLSYPVSVGLHPWHAGQNDLKTICENLAECLAVKNVLALGEIGLDRSVSVPIDLQLKAFEAQFKLAQTFNKPIIIHSVRAYTDFIPYLKKTRVPFIFHDFNGNVFEMAQLLKYNTYFSFGRSLYQPGTSSYERIVQCSFERLFIETDTAGLPVGRLYQLVAGLLDIPEVDLIKQIRQNFTKVFAPTI